MQPKTNNQVKPLVTITGSKIASRADLEEAGFILEESAQIIKRQDGKSYNKVFLRKANIEGRLGHILLPINN